MRKSLISAVIAVACISAAPFITHAVANFFVGDNGYVSIGNSDPQAPLDVTGTMYSHLSTTTSAVDWNKGNVQSLMLTSNPTLTFSNPHAGGEYKLILVQDATGGRTVTWPSNAVWVSGVAPTLSSAHNAIDLISFVYDGTSYLGTSAIGFAAPSLANGLVSYWKLDESSGSATDAVGSNTLTNNNSTAFATGKINNGANLVASNSNYFSISDASQSGLDLSGDATFSFWVKPASVSSDPVMIMKSSAYYVQLHESSHLLRFVWSNDGTNFDSEAVTIPSMSAGTWYHLALTYKASTATIQVYFNGTYEGSVSGTRTSLVNSSGAFELGRYTLGNSNYYDGVLDEVGLWNRVLTSSEIASLYNSGSGDQYPF